MRELYLNRHIGVRRAIRTGTSDARRHMEFHLGANPRFNIGRKISRGPSPEEYAQYDANQARQREQEAAA